MRAVLKPRAGRLGCGRVAHKAVRIGHAVETVVVEQHELAVAQEPEVDLGAENVLSAALVDGERRVLRIGPAPEATVNLQLDGPAAACEYGVGIRRGTQLRAAPPRLGW